MKILKSRKRGKGNKEQGQRENKQQDVRLKPNHIKITLHLNGLNTTIKGNYMLPIRNLGTQEGLASVIGNNQPQTDNWFRPT